MAPANLSAGESVSAEALAALFPGATLYDDAELTRALIEARSPHPQAAGMLGAVEAFSLAYGDERPPRAVLAGLALPPAGATLRKNPLYGDHGSIVWPSERYRDEYAAHATYPLHSQVPRTARRVPVTESAARSREFVDLPERW